MAYINAKATPINNIMIIATVAKQQLQNLFNQSYEVYIIPLVINSLRRGHTHKHTYRQSAQDQFQETRHEPGLKNMAAIFFPINPYC